MTPEAPRKRRDFHFSSSTQATPTECTWAQAPPTLQLSAALGLSIQDESQEKERKGKKRVSSRNVGRPVIEELGNKPPVLHNNRIIMERERGRIPGPCVAPDRNVDGPSKCASAREFLLNSFLVRNNKPLLLFFSYSDTEDRVGKRSCLLLPRVWEKKNMKK